MSEGPSPQYGRPQIAHVLDPNNVNWLYKLIAQAAGANRFEVRDALKATGTPAPLNRVKAWGYGDTAADRSPMNLTELVIVLNALIAYRADPSRVAGGSGGVVDNG
jgi:hypothetical protein